MVEIQNVKKIQEINQRNAQSQNLKAITNGIPSLHNGLIPKYDYSQNQRF